MSSLFDDEVRGPAGSAVITVGGILLLVSAATKLAHSPTVIDPLEAFGFGGAKLTFTAMLEAISAFLFLMPATRPVGLLLVCSFMGGAVATHVQHDHSVLQPVAVLVILLFGAWLRHPEVLWSFRETPKVKSATASFMPTSQGLRP